MKAVGEQVRLLRQLAQDPGAQRASPRHPAAAQALSAHDKSCGRAAYQIDQGDLVGVVRSILCIAKLQPSYFLNSAFSGRLFLPQNLRRARKFGALLIRDRSQA